MKENSTGISLPQKVGVAVLESQIWMGLKSIPETSMYSMVCCSGVSYLN